MVSEKKKGVRIPLRISLTVMIFTLFVYIWGPKRWIEVWNWYEIGTVLLISIYFLSFALGYRLRSDTIMWRGLEENYKNEEEIDRVLRLLRLTIYINLILTIANAFLYTGVSNIHLLFNKMIVGLTSPDTVYYHKDASSRAGSIIVWISLFYSPYMYITTVMSVYLFRRLRTIQKVVVVITLVIEAARWLALGTNKGLFDIVLLFVALYIIRRVRYYSSNEEKTIEDKRRNRKLLVLTGIAIIAFFLFFESAISARVGGKYAIENYQDFPYNMIPENLRFFIDKFDSYLCQGYDNFEKIIETCSFKWTYGIGNSRFLLSIIDRLFGSNIVGRTYPYQLGGYGVDPLVSWHSAYAWFASDLTFFGIIPFMFCIGYFFAGLTIDIISNEDPVSITLFYFMILAIFNASCTNYVLAYTNGFAGFWTLFFAHWFKQRRVTICLGKRRLRFR